MDSQRFQTAATGLGHGVLQTPFSPLVRLGQLKDKPIIIRISLVYESFLQAEAFVLHSHHPSVEEVLKKGVHAGFAREIGIR